MCVFFHIAIAHSALLHDKQQATPISLTTTLLLNSWTSSYRRRPPRRHHSIFCCFQSGHACPKYLCHPRCWLFTGSSDALPCCDPTSLLSSVAADDALLESFGYRPELHRAMGFFTNFGMSFSIVSILTGLTGEQKSCSCRAAEWVTPVASLMMVPVAAWLPPLHRLTCSSFLMRSSSTIAVLRSMMCHSRFNYKVQFSTFEHCTSLLLPLQSMLLSSN